MRCCGGVPVRQQAARSGRAAMLPPPISAIVSDRECGMAYSTGARSEQRRAYAHHRGAFRGWPPRSPHSCPSRACPAPPAHWPASCSESQADPNQSRCRSGVCTVRQHAHEAPQPEPRQSRDGATERGRASSGGDTALGRFVRRCSTCMHTFSGGAWNAGAAPISARRCAQPVDCVHPGDCSATAESCWPAADQ